MPPKQSKLLEGFPNPSPHRDYMIRMQILEFTCLCPRTGQPDFATLFLDYVPERKCVELKSLNSTSRPSGTRGRSTKPSPTAFATTS